MNILAIDTSSLNATVAVLNDEKLLGEFIISNKNTHSQIIMPMLDEMLKFAGIDIDDIDVFATAIGPGSFTGLRIGIASAKALAQGSCKKIIGISSLNALAENVYEEGKIICPIIDARRGDVYNALYLNGECIVKDRAININELITELKSKNEKIVFVGDGVLLHKDTIANELGENAQFAMPSKVMAKASSVANLALNRAKNNDFDDIYSLEPIYLRQSQAEREYNNK